MNLLQARKGILKTRREGPTSAPESMGGAASVDASSAANLLALSSLTLDDDINHVKATTIPVAYGEPKEA